MVGATEWITYCSHAMSRSADQKRQPADRWGLLLFHGQCRQTRQALHPGPTLILSLAIGVSLMRSITRTALVLACSAALAGSMAVPASAADTTTTVTIANGGVSLAAPPTAVLSAGIPGTNSTVTLGNTTVTDARAGILNWTATVSLSALTVGDETIPTTAASYFASTASLTGGSVLIAPSSQLDLSTAKTSQETSTVSGNNTAIWTALLTVPIPAQALAGTYSGTLTQSVS
jgi:hypothetical protein